jgi:hypothetical protein
VEQNGNQSRPAGLSSAGDSQSYFSAIFDEDITECPALEDASLENPLGFSFCQYVDAFQVKSVGLEGLERGKYENGPIIPSG